MDDDTETHEVQARRTRFAEQRHRLAAKHLRSPRADSIARGVHHVAMICRDVEETIGFYQDLVGFPLVDLFENRDYPGSTHFFFDLGHSNTLAFFDFPGLDLGPAVESIGSLQHLAISVTPEQFSAASVRLAAAGIPLHGPDHGIEGSIYFRDPNGIQVELTTDPLFEMMGEPLGT